MTDAFGNENRKINLRDRCVPEADIRCPALSFLNICHALMRTGWARQLDCVWNDVFSHKPTIRIDVREKP